MQHVETFYRLIRVCYLVIALSVIIGVLSVVFFYWPVMFAVRTRRLLLIQFIKIY